MPASTNDSMMPMCDHPRAEPLPNASPMRGAAMRRNPATLLRDPAKLAFLGAYVAFQHKTDISIAAANVCFWGQSRHSDWTSSSGWAPPLVRLAQSLFPEFDHAVREFAPSNPRAPASFWPHVKQGAISAE